MTRFLICGEQTHALNKQRCHRNRQKQFKILWNQMVLNKSWLYCKMWNVTGHKIDSVQTCLELLALNGLVFFCRFSSTKEYISLAAFYTELFWHISFFKTVADYISTFCNYLDRFTFVFYIQEVGRLGFRTFSWQGRTTRRLCFWWSRMLASRASRLITTGLGRCGCRRGLGYFWGHTTKEEIEAEEKRRRDGA